MKRASSLLLAALLAVIGCDDRELVGSLDVRQAVEVEVTLSEAGIAARREKIGGGRSQQFQIFVSDAAYDDAIRVLHQYQLPRDKDADIEKLTAGSGFLPAPPELAMLRRERVQAAEIERMLHLFPGVVDARAIVRTERNKWR